MRISSWVALYLLISSSAAYEEYDYSNEHSPTGSKRGNNYINQSVRWPLKFDDWYSEYQVGPNTVSTIVSNLSLKAYHGDMAARVALGPVERRASAGQMSSSA